ncbi:MAG: type III secretion system chaperone [Candidatus Competibacteraceae bacterium]|nr:type III secretion system chaperone [Candidatus Competibacteraceae bacterium]
MDERAIINASLVLVGQVWGAELELSPDGACTLSFEEGLEVALWHDAETGRLHIDADLVDIHAEHRPGIYKRALALNYSAFENAGVVIVLDRENHELMARSILLPTVLEPKILAEQIADVLLAAKALHEQLHLDHSHESDQQHEGSEHLAHHSAGFIKI